MRIALDAMGVITFQKTPSEGAVLALKKYPYIEKLFLVGEAVAIGNELKRLDFKNARIEIFHASGSCLDEGVGGKGGPPRSDLSRSPIV